MMKVLLARDTGTEFRFRVHLDDTKVDANGEPDPEWVEEFAWGKEPPPGRTPTQYLADIQREMKMLCEQRLAAKNQGAPLSMEGQTL